MVFATRKLIFYLDPAVSVTVGEAANLRTLVLLAIHELYAWMGTYNLQDALMAFFLDIVTTIRLPRLNHFVTRDCSLVYVAGFFPLMTTLSKREVNSRLALGVNVRVAAYLIAGMQSTVHEFFARLRTSKLRLVNVTLLRAWMLALVVDYVNLGLAGYLVRVFKAFSLE